MALPTVEQRETLAGARLALLTERFGEAAELASEQHRQPQPRPARGLAAPRCLVCLREHDHALNAGRFPQPVRRAIVGADRCQLHLNRGS